MARDCSGRTRVAVTLLACAIAAGCRPARLRPEVPATLPSPAQLLQLLTERRQALSSVRGFAQISYKSGEENLGSRHAVLVRRPDHFRLEVLSPFGALAVVASDGRDLVVYARRENKIYRGAATPGSVGAYTGVPVPVEDVVAVLLGTPPERHPAGAPTVARDEDAALIRLTVPLADGRQEVWFAPDTLWPVGSATALPDGRTLKVSFADYRERGGVAFPYSIDLRAEPGDRAVGIRYTSPSINTDIVDALFAFPPRSDIEEFLIEQYPAGGSAS